MPPSSVIPHLIIVQDQIVQILNRKPTQWLRRLNLQPGMVQYEGLLAKKRKKMEMAHNVSCNMFGNSKRGNHLNIFSELEGAVKPN